MTKWRKHEEPNGIDPQYKTAGATKLIKKFLPDYCWQDWLEILTFLETINENVEENCVRVALSQLVKEKKIECRMSPRNGCSYHKKQYKMNCR